MSYEYTILVDGEEYEARDVEIRVDEEPEQLATRELGTEWRRAGKITIDIVGLEKSE